MSGRYEDADDQYLVVLATRGDRRAFEALYDRHSQGVAKALASFAGEDRDTLDDLAQEVFIRVIKNLRNLKPDRPFTHWLYTVALNVGRNHIRDNAKRENVNPAALNLIPDSSRIVPELHDEVLGRAAMRATESLPEILRSVVALRISSGMPYGEISALLCIPEGTARRRMHEALDKIRAVLGLKR